jgi:hypothetical protein
MPLQLEVRETQIYEAQIRADVAGPLGFIVVGTAQAGKSTACGEIGSTLTRLDERHVAPASVPFSNAFRGIAADAILALDAAARSEGIQNRGFLEPEDCQRYVRAYLEYIGDGHGLEDQIFRYFVKPKAGQVLRNEAVNAAVPYFSENRFLHPIVVQQAGRYLRARMHDPVAARKKETPFAAVLDGRDRLEMAEVLEAADVSLGGLFTVTCSEETCVRRKTRETDEEKIGREIARLEARNKSDRDRSLVGGLMTLPQDVSHILALHNLPFRDADTPEQLQQLLWLAGMFASGAIDRGIHINTDTDGISLAQERLYIPFVTGGLVVGTRSLSGKIPSTRLFV